MATWASYLDQHKSEYVDQLLELLRIPSISSLPENKGDVQRAAEWVANRLRMAGIEDVRILPTDGHPVVYGAWLHAAGKPTILFYGHFDVQPVDPLSLWTSPPFEPTIRDGRVYARGASDMKGNLLLTIVAVEALLKSDGKLPVNVKFFLEGQEEIGSPNVPSFLEKNRDLFACDLVVSSDGSQWSETQPSLETGYKGLAGLQVDVKGARSDLHSGLYGGAVQNAIHALVRILDRLHGPDGRIQVEGFYDDVVPLSEVDRAAIAAVPYDDAEYKRQIGVAALFGEAGYSTNERAWARPTLEINGIWGGFQGAGLKTVLPNEAHAKITCRLVPNQEPKKIVELVSAALRREVPPGASVTVQPFPGGARPYVIPRDDPGNRAAAAVLTELYGKEPYYTRSGGTLPITDLFLSSLGAYTVAFGFGMNDEQFHAPNEFLRLDNFARGQRAYCMLLERLGGR